MWRIKLGRAIRASWAGIMLVLAALACDMDQKFPPLIVGAAPRSFEPWIGEKHIWLADVTPNTKYEVILALGNGGCANAQGCSDLLNVYGNYANACAECQPSLPISLPNGKLILSFIGPKDGHAMIMFIPSKRYGASTIQLRESGRASSGIPEAIVTVVSRVDISHVLPSVFLCVFAYATIQRSHILHRKRLLENERQQPLRTNWFWLIGACLAIVLLVNIWC